MDARDSTAEEFVDLDMRTAERAYRSRPSWTTPILLFLAWIALALTAFANPPKHNVKPGRGYVPDAETAIRIAVAVWIPIYGEKQIAKQAPYRASLARGVWTVNGSLPRGHVGGVATAEITQGNARILRVSHGR